MAPSNRSPIEIPALDVLSSLTDRGMRCSTGRMENGLCGSVWYQYATDE